MKKVWIMVLAVCLAFVFMGGCISIKNSKITGGMAKEERAKFADEVACKVVEKLKAEPCCPKMAAAMAETVAEPNKPCK